MRRGSENLPNVDVSQGEMHVRIEQPWKDRPAGAVDRLVGIEAGPDIDNSFILDDNIRPGHGDSVEEVASVK